MRVLKLIFEKKNKKITLPSFFLKKIIIIFLDGYLVCQFLFKLPISFHGFFLFDKQLFCFSGLLNCLFIFIYFFCWPFVLVRQTRGKIFIFGSQSFLSQNCQRRTFLDTGSWFYNIQVCVSCVLLFVALQFMHGH
jgi:hypothetical protein